MKKTNVLILTVAVAATLLLAVFATAAETQASTTTTLEATTTTTIKATTTTTIKATTTTVASAGGCTDADGGKVFNVKGVTNGQNGKKVDTCIDPTRLREYFCEGGLAQSELVLCKKGCFDGTCRGTEGTVLSTSYSAKPTSLGAITGVTGSTTQAQTSATTTTTISEATTSSTLAAETTVGCSDSDGGKNPNYLGTVMFNGMKYTDSCISASALREWFCATSGIKESTIYRCRYGCDMGVCQPAPGTVTASTVTTTSSTTTTSTTVTSTTLKTVTTSSTSTTLGQSGNGEPTGDRCSDSDGGKVYDKKGTTNGVNGVKTDSCADPTRLKEYYCDGEVVKEELHVCEKGCNSGRCR